MYFFFMLIYYRLLKLIDFVIKLNYVYLKTCINM